MWKQSESVKLAIKEAEELRLVSVKDIASKILSDELTATYNGSAKNWQGVVKDPDGNIVYKCSHSHHNRDCSTRSSGKCATACAKAFILDVKKRQYTPPEVWSESPTWVLIPKDD